MSDACASKVLHQLVPALFVMWDVNILPGAWSYGDFMGKMHRLALHLSAQAPSSAEGDLEAYLQERLGYPIRKPPPSTSMNTTGTSRSGPSGRCGERLRVRCKQPLRGTRWDDSRTRPDSGDGVPSGCSASAE